MLTFTNVQAIQPLTAFNFGGDEVALGAFENMEACKELVARSPDLDLTSESLQKYFVQNVATLVHQHSLDLIGWEDGLIEHSVIPYNRYV